MRFPTNAHKKLDVLSTLEKIFPKEGVKEFAIGLLDLGINLCLPKKPKCEECPINQLCNYRLKRQR